MTGNNANQNMFNIFLSNLSLFTDKRDDDGVFLRDFPGKDPEGARKMFNAFYGHNMIFDVMRQWIMEPGPFDFSFGEIVMRPDIRENEKWIRDQFVKFSGVDLPHV